MHSTTPHIPQLSRPNRLDLGRQRSPAALRAQREERTIRAVSSVERVLVVPVCRVLAFTALLLVTLNLAMAFPAEGGGLAHSVCSATQLPSGTPTLCYFRASGDGQELGRIWHSQVAELSAKVGQQGSSTPESAQLLRVTR